MGCRKFKGRQWLDDLDGQTYLPEDLEEIVFVLDGEAKVIHLNRANADAFREAMSPYVDAAQPTTKSKVLSTLPRKKRHLSIVPSTQSDSEPREEAQNSPVPHKGEAVEALSEPGGTRVPEAPSKPSDFSPLEEPAKAVLSVVRPPKPEPVPEAWAPYAPELRDDKADKMLKARQWAGQMAMELPDNMVTPEVLIRWKGFYKERRWLNIT